MMKKRILIANRVRQVPREGFSWIDRRFLREFASKLSHDGINLYFFLAAVSDKHGLSFYRDHSIAVKLRTSEPSIVAARDELITHDLIAYQSPLTQVLSLPRATRIARGGLHALGELFRSNENNS